MRDPLKSNPWSRPTMRMSLCSQPIGRLMQSSLLLYLLLPARPPAVAQTPRSTATEPASAAAAGSSADPVPNASPSAFPDPSLDRRLAELSGVLTQTQRMLETSMQELQRVQAELSDLRAQVSSSGSGQTPSATPTHPATGESAADLSYTAPAMPANSPSETSDSSVARLHEEQEAVQAEVQQHEQTKVETTSKYPLKLTGLVLFNAFANSGTVDNIDLPTLALPRAVGSSHGSAGGSARQSILGLDARGPRLASARSFASLSVDLFGDLSYNFYSSPNGSVRLRRAELGLEWKKSTLNGGIQEPLISPLSPTSYAAVAQPALSWAGNLWTWSPQLRVEQRMSIRGGSLHLEGGLFDPLPVELTASQVSRIPSASELARQPAFEGRASWHAGEGDRSLVVGLGAYTSEQSYNAGATVHSWAGTADWTLPLWQQFTLRGEAYRGRALAGLGGGAYKNVLIGTDPRTGLTRTNGVDAVGGWSQLTWKPAHTLEANASFGLDDALASNFRRLDLTASPSNPLQFYSRNSMLIANVVLRPRTYLIFSPEYRRILSGRFGAESYDANVFTISAGYQF